MRGNDDQTEGLFSYVSCEARVPSNHPLRAIRAIVDEALEVMSPELEALYSDTGRPSIAPEKLLRSLLLQAFYSVRSERQLMEQLQYNLLFRWFVGLSMDAPIWDATVFTKNRERFLQGDVAARLLSSVLGNARVRSLLSSEHFSVDGTLIEAWASLKSFRPKDGSGSPPGPGRNSERNFHGEKRSNETHASTSDPDAMLARKGWSQSAKLSFMGHVLMENRSGLVVSCRLTQATGTAEREAALEMVGELPGSHRVTVGCDKGYDAYDFVEGLRALGATPHVAQSISRSRGSCIDRRTTRHPGYAASQMVRKRIEEAFGWIKTVAGLRKTRHRGLARVGWMFAFATAAYNLIRIPTLIEATH
jgi:transposase